MDSQTLYTLLKFDESDLFANRNGRLTAKQQARLASDAKFGKKIALAISFFFLAFAIAPGVIAGVNAAHCIADLCSEWPDSLRIFLVILLLTWTPIWAWISIRLFISAASPFRIPALLKVEGPINIVKVESYNAASKTHSENYELRLGGETFDVAAELADIVMQGDVYAVYYLKEAMQIMSAELISQGS
jgi:hypothetical protein